MNRTWHLVGVAILSGFASLQCAAQAVVESTPFPAMNDYAWGFPIDTPEAATFYTVELPLSVNRAVVDPRLRDAGVYNADGEPVPRLFRPTSDDVEQLERSRSLRFVPLYKTVGDAVATADDVRLVFERDGDRTRLELDSRGAPGADARVLDAYIVDTRQVDETVTALDLSWTQNASGFIGKVNVQGSDDLEQWHPVGTAAIADLNDSGAQILKRRVALSAGRYDFLRIRWSDLPEGWQLDEITGIYTIGVPGIVRRQIMLGSNNTDPRDGGRIFDLGGAPKIDRLRIVLPSTNTVISARVYLWAENQLRWYRVADGTFYNVGRGDNVVTSEPLKISKSRSNRIKVVVTRGQPDVPMRLEVGWRPDTLVFVAHGPPPYTLVAGRAEDVDSDFPQERRYGMPSLAGLVADNGQTGQASIGPQFELAGPVNLVQPAAIPWRRIVLWVALLCGVALVGGMAFRILKDPPA